MCKDGYGFYLSVIKLLYDIIKRDMSFQSKKKRNIETLSINIYDIPMLTRHGQFDAVGQYMTVCHHMATTLVKSCFDNGGL